jgi:outer membrane protein
MNRLLLSILFAAIWMPVLAMAQTPSQPPAAQAPVVIGTAKIGWMNLEQAVLTTDEGKNMVAEIQKYVESKNTENNNLRKELDTLRNQLEVQGSKLTDEARIELEEQIESKDTALQRFQQDTQKDIENRRLKMTNYLARRMQPVIEKLAKEKGVSAILIFNSSRDAYVDPSLNLTDEIVKAYNQANGSGAKAAAPVAAPKTAPAPSSTPSQKK